MNVSLTPQLEKFIDKKVRDGAYQTASEVVREALRLLADQDTRRSLELQYLRQQVQAGLDDAREGRVSTLDMKRIKAEARKELAGRRLRQVG
jgi:antitoxin ParD1/3/4